MGLILTATAGLCLWIVLWALNVSGFDAILIAVLMVLHRDRCAQRAAVPARSAGLTDQPVRSSVLAASRGADPRPSAERSAPERRWRPTFAGCAAAGELERQGERYHAHDLRQLARRLAQIRGSRTCSTPRRLAFYAEERRGHRVQARVPSDHRRTSSPTTRARRSRTPGAIAYLGEILPGASADSLGITNAQDLLQVAPTDTALELTQADADALEHAGALLRVAEDLRPHVRARRPELAAGGEGPDPGDAVAVGQASSTSPTTAAQYGKAIAAAVKQDASPAITVVPSQAGADAIFYGASSDSAAIRTFNAAAQSNPTIKLFGPSALDDDALASGVLAGATQRLHLLARVPAGRPDAGRPAVRQRLQVGVWARPGPGGDLRLRGDGVRAERAQAGRQVRERPRRPSCGASSRSRTAPRCSGRTRSTPTATPASRRSCSAACGRGSSSRSSSSSRRGESTGRGDQDVRRSLAVAAALLAAVLVLAGCGSKHSDGATIRGTTLTIYSSVPLHGASRVNAAGRRQRGISWRCSQLRDRIGKYRIVFKPLDDSTAAAGRVGSGPDDRQRASWRSRTRPRSATSASSTRAPARSRSRS